MMQKYRMRRRHVLPKDEGNRTTWQRHGNLAPVMTGGRSCRYRPIVAFTTSAAVAAAGYPVWGHPHAAAVQSWPSAATFPPWRPPVDQHWPWKSYTRVGIFWHVSSSSASSSSSSQSFFSSSSPSSSSPPSSLS